MKRRDTWLLAAHSLAEANGVLTRLPGRRLASEDAFAVLRANWGRTEAVSLTPAEYWVTLERGRTLDIAGGRIYDALIAACARKARAHVLLTWDVGHFTPLAEGFEVRAPGSDVDR